MLGPGPVRRSLAECPELKLHCPDMRGRVGSGIREAQLCRCGHKASPPTRFHHQALVTRLVARGGKVPGYVQAAFHGASQRESFRDATCKHSSCPMPSYSCAVHLYRWLGLWPSMPFHTAPKVTDRLSGQAELLRAKFLLPDSQPARPFARA